MTSILKLALVGACALSFAGCASIVEGTDQQISVSTPGANGANCNLTSSDGSYNINSTPGSVTVGKSMDDITVLCKKAGYENANSTISSGFAAWTLGNLIIGGPIGVVIDAASGAMNEYPENVSVTMRKEAAPSAPVSQSSSDSSIPTS